MNSKEIKNKIFEPVASSKAKYLILMAIAVFILITVKPVIEYGMPEILIIAVAFPRSWFYYYDGRSYR